ncbi:MAG: hypothetical protein J6Y02_12675 [Pseudobutyrivibrio sp.]|nr:hypothetical protein [Pseudobutyrivibrio sp.]
MSENKKNVTPDGAEVEIVEKKGFLAKGKEAVSSFADKHKKGWNWFTTGLKVGAGVGLCKLAEAAVGAFSGRKNDDSFIVNVEEVQSVEQIENNVNDDNN